VKTKKVHGVQLGPSAFAYVGDPKDTSTWHVCIHVLGDPAKTVNAVKTALGRFDETKGIRDCDREMVWHTLRGAALALGIHVDERSKREATTQAAESTPTAPEQVPVIEPKPAPKVRTPKEIEIDRAIEEAVAMADLRADELLRALGLE